MQNIKKKYLIMATVGIIIALLIDSIIPFDHPESHNRLYDYFLSITLTIIIWEGNLYIDRKLNQRLPWVKRPGIRIMAQLPIAIVFSALSIYAGMAVYNKFACHLPAELESTLFITSIVIGTLFSIILVAVEISMQFFMHWKNSLLEVEKYKTESLQAQLQNLKDQINPHFLFNNLSVLSSLVYKDQDKAVDFINQLSKVYRYLLDNRNSELTTLDDELTFIKSYNYLLQIRFGSNIIFKMDIDRCHSNKLIPPMSLQMLIENAIKHNEISSEQPLTVDVFCDEAQLIVSNNLQPRLNHEPSSKTGLQNIMDRYKHFSDKEVEVYQDQKSFTVKIPLLNPK